jgi:hypothetical protein
MGDIAFYGALIGAGAAAAVGAYLLVRRYYHVGAIRMGDRQVPITAGDRLWLARMVLGETGGRDRQAAAATLWALATRLMTLPAFRSMTSFTQLIRAFSTPVKTGCPINPSYCQRISATSWEAMPELVRVAVDDFIAGELPNPIPDYNNWAADWAIGSSSMSRSQLPPRSVGGNTFVRDPQSISGDVRIV